ncbi:hypothetical protein ACHAPU_007749 [Fusarium lateritium]
MLQLQHSNAAPPRGDKTAVIEKVGTAVAWKVSNTDFLRKIMDRTIQLEELANDIKYHITKEYAPLVSEEFRDKILLACYELKLDDQIAWLQQPAKDQVTIRFRAGETYLSPGPMMDISRELQDLAISEGLDRKLAGTLMGYSEKIVHFQ